MAHFTKEEFERLGIIIRVPPKRKRHKPGSGGGADFTKARLRRMVRKAPEVMVKITGRCNKGFKHLREHLNYISRNGELVVESSDGGILYGRQAVGDTAHTWWGQRGVVPGSRRANSAETVNFMLSMPAGTDRDKFMDAARTFAAKAFGGNYDYLIAEHRDTDHTHVHLTVRARGHDGQRLNPRKYDLQMWREWLAQDLREKGIEAEATPRQARGVVKKSKGQAVTHLDMRGESRVQRAKVVDMVRQVMTKSEAGARPWEVAIAEKQSAIRQAWVQLADRFEREGGAGQAFARDIRQFVRDMPKVETERDAIRKAVESNIQQRDRGNETER